MRKGREEGRKEGRREAARKMKESGLSIEQIARFTGLSTAKLPGSDAGLGAVVQDSFTKKANSGSFSYNFLDLRRERI